MSGELYRGVYAGRRVLVTGHTGFLGTWAVRWLRLLGAEVAGYSRSAGPGYSRGAGPGYSRGQRSAPLSPESATRGMREFAGDIADAERVAAAMSAFQPEIVLHLAGSTVVAAGFRSPAETFRSNVVGTAATLDAATRQKSVRCAVVIGTPAVTRLGDDLQLGPYAASKLAAEACAGAFAHARTQQMAGRAEPLRIGLARPGVMIGGDWAEGRVLADVVRSIKSEQAVTLAAPQAVRPWQHVLDGVSGALTLAARLWAEPAPRARYDFGCDQQAVGMSVHDLVDGFLTAYGTPEWPVRMPNGKTAGCGDKVELGYAAARVDLGWRPVWDLSRALTACAAWYQAAQADPGALAATTDDQIAAYAADAANTWMSAHSHPSEGATQCVYS